MLDVLSSEDAPRLLLRNKEIYAAVSPKSTRAYLHRLWSKRGSSLFEPVNSTLFTLAGRNSVPAANPIAGSESGATPEPAGHAPLGGFPGKDHPASSPPGGVEPWSHLELYYWSII